MLSTDLLSNRESSTWQQYDDTFAGTILLISHAIEFRTQHGGRFPTIAGLGHIFGCRRAHSMVVTLAQRCTLANPILLRETDLSFQNEFQWGSGHAYFCTLFRHSADASCTKLSFK